MVYCSEPVDEILWCDHSSESQRAVLPCGTVYKVFLTFVSVDENLSCDDSNETSSAALLYVLAIGGLLTAMNVKNF